MRVFQFVTLLSDIDARKITAKLPPQVTQEIDNAAMLLEGLGHEEREALILMLRHRILALSANYSLKGHSPHK